MSLEFPSTSGNPAAAYTSVNTVAIIKMITTEARITTRAVLIATGYAGLLLPNTVKT